MPRKNSLSKVFRISLMLKGVDGFLEIIGALFVILIPPSSINSLVTFLTQHELSQDPNDLLASHLVSWASQFSASSALFSFVYLLSHGLVKIVLVTAVIKNKLWAYPWMVAFLMAFIIYQLYRLTHKFTIGLSLLTLFDIFIVVLTWIEYQKQLATNHST